MVLTQVDLCIKLTYVPACHGRRTLMRSSVPLRVHCTSADKLSSRCLFLARAAVRRHISATKSCREAGLGFREVHVDTRAGDVMAGAGGVAGPASDVRHQPPGDTECCERKIILLLSRWTY
jgi:hypothetical protein